ncbi:hypothetical protein LRD69_07955 [Streptomyces sp. JH14]|uniref:PASTA domain-containing protein n=1 Tax=Streptomyces sp. JH14 TaxID=2793630 RepID=UPI0023F6DD79|nr:hypothetical protein [Streptomyces sp. JH14]MDF6042099.1 hypothetical protein [Streptomyces sp. JH14]
MSGPQSHESSPPPSSAPGPWWQTGAARMGAIAAVPLLGLVSDQLGGVALLVALILLWWRNPWPRSGRVVASVAAMALLGAVLPGQPADTPARAANTDAAKPSTRPSRFPTASRATPEATMPTVPDFTGDSLDVAFPKSLRRGFTVIYHDASDQKREVTARSLWKVCFQVTGGSSEEPIVDFGVVRRGEPCPEAEGKTVPWKKMPDVLGLTWRAAVPKVTAAGVPEDDVHAEAAYLNDTLPREGEYDDWRVCRQDPASGGPLTDEVYVVSLALSSPNHGCPAPDRGRDAYLPDRDDDGDPDYLDPYPRDRNRTRLYPNGIPGGTGGSGGSGGSGDGWHICRHTRWC